ncbi:UNVERIFIED_CONTAM: hypothetical protein H355_008570 [Colinus virginianus]|nr:hypothetical protein H355_008570 [Colinus virginianus]
MVEVSKAQDVEAGDGTTGVVVLCAALLEAAQHLLDRGVHPQKIASAFFEASKQVLPQGEESSSVDLNDIRVVKRLGGTVDESELVEGIVLVQQKISKKAGGPTRIQNAKIGLIQFCLSAPKTDMENNIVIKDYSAMDRMLREERIIIVRMVKHIAATGCNVLLIQKSILRDAVNDLSLDYLAKAKILVVQNIEREEIEFISRTVGCHPVASLDHFTADRLGHADLVQDEAILDETERSLHDALCVVRCLVKKKFLLPGGGAAEAELSVKLSEWCVHPQSKRKRRKEEATLRENEDRNEPKEGGKRRRIDRGSSKEARR